MVGPFEHPHQKFVNKEAAAAGEFESAWKKFEKDIETTDDPSQLFINAKAEVQNISSRYADWYVNNEKLYSIRGNQYQQEIYKKADAAKGQIDRIKDLYNQREHWKKQFDKNSLKYAEYDAQFDLISGGLENVVAFTDLDTIEDVTETETSLQTCVHFSEKARSLYDKYNAYEIVFNHEGVPQQERQDMKDLAAAMKKRFETAKDNSAFLLKHADRLEGEHDKALGTIKANIDEKIKTEESKLGEYKDQSGVLQEKYHQQKPGEKEITSEDLKVAYGQYKDYVPFLKAFAGRVKNMKLFGSGKDSGKES